MLSESYNINFEASFTVIAGIVHYAVLIGSSGSKNVPAMLILVHTSPPFCPKALVRLRMNQLDYTIHKVKYNI
nr:MAG TPA: hypothetical protein [Caudoviricetes sp.]DAT63803.1 MAG TPA: hypothetical protein [Caudoviricetes sp.]